METKTGQSYLKRAPPRDQAKNFLPEQRRFSLWFTGIANPVFLRKHLVKLEDCSCRAKIGLSDKSHGRGASQRTRREQRRQEKRTPNLIGRGPVFPSDCLWRWRNVKSAGRQVDTGGSRTHRNACSLNNKAAKRTTDAGLVAETATFVQGQSFTDADRDGQRSSSLLHCGPGPASDWALGRDRAM